MHGRVDARRGVIRMAAKLKLYMFTGSTPSRSVQLMLEHKGLDHKRVHVMVGPHAFGMLGRGFQTMTVPALKIGSQRVQGSREISRALDELAPQPPLFPADPQRRGAVADAERFGEQLQDAVRRIFWCAARRDRRAFHSVLRHRNPLIRMAQRVTRTLVIRLATAGHRATDRAGQEDLAALPRQLDQLDAWIKDGLLAGPEPNAADFQIAPNIALLLCFEDLAPFIEGRPAAQLAKIAPAERPVQIGAVLPKPWLAPLHAAVARGPQPGPNASHGTLRPTSSEANWTNSLLRQDSALPHEHRV